MTKSRISGIPSQSIYAQEKDKTMPVHIVVVEDDDYLRELLCIQIGDLGHRVTSFENGREVKNKIEKLTQQPDMIFLDLILPHISGVELLKWLREQSSLKQVPVVVLTGHKEDKLISQCLKYGVKDFLLKPIPESLLRSRLRIFDVRLECNHARSILSKCFIEAPDIFLTGPFKRYRNKGQTPFRIDYADNTFVVLIDQSFTPAQLLEFDEELLSQHCRIYTDQGPWLPVFPSRSFERREAKPVEENELRKSLGDELFNLVHNTAKNRAY